MSHLTMSDLYVPEGVTVMFSGKNILIKGKFGELKSKVHDDINVDYQDNYLIFSSSKKRVNSRSLIGTTRSLLNNMLIGVTNRFRKTLQLVGIGYRFFIKKDNVVDLFLGFSHVIHYKLPEGISIKSSVQNEIIVIGIDKHLVGKTASDIRSCRPPERYKGKGIRYLNEVVLIKEAKKK
ncbi:MAG: 50S ribosomal subunit protein L6 [Candidatus Westeberhardia cardiocondylae]|nr:50S ribosomal subunit protein L6 [Candidatus Westeberhardia cardiocondylae]